jgi:hypothetical protein
MRSSIPLSPRSGKCLAGRSRLRKKPFIGQGTYKGERVSSLKTGADIYIDASFNCKKP